MVNYDRINARIDQYENDNKEFKKSKDKRNKSRKAAREASIDGKRDMRRKQWEATGKLGKVITVGGCTIGTLVVLGLGTLGAMKGIELIKKDNPYDRKPEKPSKIAASYDNNSGISGETSNSEYQDDSYNYVVDNLDTNLDTFISAQSDENSNQIAQEKANSYGFIVIFNENALSPDFIQSMYDEYGNDNIKSSYQTTMSTILKKINAICLNGYDPDTMVGNSTGLMYDTTLESCTMDPVDLAWLRGVKQLFANICGASKDGKDDAVNAFINYVYSSFVGSQLGDSNHACTVLRIYIPCIENMCRNPYTGESVLSSATQTSFQSLKDEVMNGSSIERTNATNTACSDGLAADNNSYTRKRSL